MGKTNEKNNQVYLLVEKYGFTPQDAAKICESKEIHLYLSNLLNKTELVRQKGRGYAVVV